MSALRPFALAVLELVMPSICPLCRTTSGPELCADCLASLPRLQHPCPWCGAAGCVHGECRLCHARGLRGIAAVQVHYHYYGALEVLVGNAKAAGRPAAVHACARLAAADLRVHGTVVIPIAETPGRRPGPHLASAMAKAIARTYAIPFRRTLSQTRRPRSQHSLNHAERQRNVAGVFISTPVPANVILVDDLLTSGATAEAAAQALRAAGAKRIELVCLARTPRKDELAGLSARPLSDVENTSGNSP